MFSINYHIKMFHLILLLLYSSYLLQESAANKIGKISKDAAIITSTSSPLLKQILKTGILNSDVKVSKTVPETEIGNKQIQNYEYEIHKEMEIHQKVKDLGINFANVLYLKQNNSKEGFASNNATINLSKLIYLKLASALKSRLHRMIAKAFQKHTTISNSFEDDSEITSESTEVYADSITDSSAKKSEGTLGSSSNEEAPTGRQFVFHPYLPYDKDVSPDEKISIGDVLPVKVMKFFKGMVEDAPWEQMFQKMVRMIVDQFVDKIIEKMFAHKDDDHEWRSLDGGSAKSAWSLPNKVLTYVVRSRRSTEGKAKSEHLKDWIEKDPPSANRVSKEDRSKAKEPTEEESWLDSILDYLFPDDPKAADDSEKYRKKRDAIQPLLDNSDQIEAIRRRFLARYLAFQQVEMNGIPKDSNRHGMTEITSDNDSKHGDSKISVGASSSRSSDTSQDSKSPESVDAPARSPKNKRSLPDESEKDVEEERLWQANRRSRPSNRKSRDDCSLRRACNAGRLLSRLPSVQDITMQLKAHGNEPHWDALLWGMTKKRCSRIFCKRQRSPKGTKHHHWGDREKIPLLKSSRLRFDESDHTTIYPV